LPQTALDELHAWFHSPEAGLKRGAEMISGPSGASISDVLIPEAHQIARRLYALAMACKPQGGGPSPADSDFWMAEESAPC
jgi:hypothetical protein